MIYRLSERPEFAAETAALMTRTWPGHYGLQGGGNAMADVLSRIEDDRVAIALMEGRVVGTVAVSDKSYGSLDEGPWLVGLCIAASARGHGVGTALVTWAAGKASREGHISLFATTQDAVGVLRRLGWRQVRTITDETGDWSVWKIDLAAVKDG